MNANDQFYARDAQVDAAAVAPLPNSRKIYVEGSRPDIRVPMREIAQSDTPASFGAEKNPPIVVYDTSGPYTDPAAQSTSAAACRRCAPRGSPSAATPRSSTARPPRYGRARLADPELAGLRFDLKRKPRRAAVATARRQRHADALRPPRHRHAGDGVHRHPREPEARGNAAALPEIVTAPASRARASAPRSRAVITPEFVRDEVARGRAIIPGQHQPPGNRADDHRPQLPGEDQRQHRQLGACPRRSTRKSRRWRGRSAGAPTR